jgi:4-diphosphocytidyl-2C-methyl-D-erythritol kinase
MLEALQRADFDEVQALLQNDFHDVLAEQRPEIAAALCALRTAGATNALLAGSGSCVFTLAADAQGIAEIQERLALSDDYERFPTHFAATPHWR